MVGLCVCWSVDWNYGWPMVGLPIGLFVIWFVGQSVKPSGRFAIYLLVYQPPTDRPRTDRPPKHPSTGPWPTNQRNFFYKRWVLEFPLSGFNVPPFSFRSVGCGRAAWPMPANYWSSLRSGSSSLYWGYIPPRLDGHYPNRLIWEHPRVYVLIVMSFIPTCSPILMLYTAYIAPQTPYD